MFYSYIVNIKSVPSVIVFTFDTILYVDIKLLIYLNNLVEIKITKFEYLM